MDVLIVGGGLIGGATALALAKRGADVTLVERARFGAEASSGAAGILGAQVEHTASAELRALLVGARIGYAAWIAELEERSGRSVGYAARGALALATAPGDAEELEARVEAQRNQGLRAEIVRGQALFALERAVSTSVSIGAFFPDDGSVEPVRLCEALRDVILREPRVRLLEATEVRRLSIVGDVCAGAILHHRGSASDVEEVLSASQTVLAGGSWSSELGVGPRVMPVRGQLVELESTPAIPSHVVFGLGGYLVPRGDGRVVAGTTVERVGFERAVTPEGIRTIRRIANALVPVFDRARLMRAWCSFRPALEGASPDALPFVGPTALRNLHAATGHFRNGILLAPYTGELLARQIVG